MADTVHSPYLRTFTGKTFGLKEPKAENVVLDDIAHALGLLCRFCGHVHRFYCPTLEQRILTTALEWKAVGELRAGDKLLGLDEHPVPTGTGSGKNRRKIRASTVLIAQSHRATVRDIKLDDGTRLRCSREHPWLVATKMSRNQIWKTTDEIANDIAIGRKRYLHRFFMPWVFENTRDAGWLAGMFDGEGYLSAKNRRGVTCGVSQQSGATLDRLAVLLRQFGFQFGTSKTGKSTMTHQIRGGWRGVLELIGRLRPHRLLGKFEALLADGHFAKQADAAGKLPLVVSVSDPYEDEVMGIETDTHTYFCEGFAAHNSVAEHCIVMSRMVPEPLKLYALLHDAPEAYTVDLPRPVKQMLPAYKVLETKVEAVVYEAFGIELPTVEIAKEIKAADVRMYLTERAQLFEPFGIPKASSRAGKPFDYDLRCWSPCDASWLYKDRFKKLIGNR